MLKPRVYFVSDVHLGLDVNNPKDREDRFVGFLKSLPAETSSIYLLGDIWDFWYEYRDVVPKGYVNVFAALQDLLKRGVKVYFFQGNHDVWTYSYFEELGLIKLEQPYVIEIAGKRLCLGHGDGLGDVPLGYKFLRGVFHNKVLQVLFSTLHPWFAFRLGNNWSKSSRLARKEQYIFKGQNEPLVKWAEDFSRENKIDYFIFGHYHVNVQMKLESGAELFILNDWIESSPYLYFDGISISGGYFQNNE